MSLSDNELRQLKSEVIERDYEIDALNAFITREAELSSPCVLVNSYKPVGKTYTVKAFLRKLGVRHSVIQCDECVSKQMLLHRCYKSILQDSGISETDSSYMPTLNEGFAQFLAALEEFITKYNYTEHHVLVLDRFDQIFENCDSVLLAFSRFRECSKVQNLSVIAIFSGSTPRDLVTYSNPRIFFQPYNEEQIIKILDQGQFCQFNFDTGERKEKEVEFYNQYVKLIVDSFFDYTGSDLTMLKMIITSLWDKFVEKVRIGEYGLNDIVKIYKENMDVFTTRDNYMTNANVKEYRTQRDEVADAGFASVQDLPLHSKFILLASYLASHGNQRNDLHKYSKVKVVKYKKRASRKNVNGHLNKEDIDSRLLTATYVDLERILAILSIIYQHLAPLLNQSDKDDLYYLDDRVIENELKKEQEKLKFTLTRNIDLNSQIATLSSLGLLNKTQTSDILAARVRWRCNLDWPTAEAIAKNVNFPISEFLIED